MEYITWIVMVSFTIAGIGTTIWLIYDIIVPWEWKRNFPSWFLTLFSWIITISAIITVAVSCSVYSLVVQEVSQ